MSTTVTLRSVQGNSIAFETQMSTITEDPAVIEIEQLTRWAFGSGDIYREGLRIEIPAELMDQLAQA